MSEFQLKENTQLFRGAGCSSCKQGGYKGRVGIFELLSMAQAIKELIVSKAPAHTIRDVAHTAGMRTLRDDGLNKAMAGLTTIEEVIRVTQLE